MRNGEMIFKKIIWRIRKFINQSHAFDYKTCELIVKYDKNPILGNNGTGSFFDPYVVEWQNGLYRIYISERRTGNIITFISNDGISWTSKSVALSSGGKGNWDEVVNRPCVIQVNHKWIMWYTGQSSGVSKIGWAESLDGIEFKRKTTNPILEGSFSYEGVSVMNPSVIYDEKNKMFYMWYAAGENYEPDCICFAKSKDGKKWEKYHSPILTANKTNEYEKSKVGGCEVRYFASIGYILFYIGYQNVNVGRICVAISKNGINDWRESKYNPLVCPTKHSWDCDSVYKPTFLQNKKDNQIKIWYNGRSKTNEYIGLATIGYNDFLEILNVVKKKI